MDIRRQKELDWLLSRGRLSGPALERVLDGATKAATRQSRWHRFSWGLHWLAPAGVVAVAVLFVLPSRVDTSSFRSKGGGAASSTPRLELLCGEHAGSDLRCAHDDTLYFSATGGQGSWFLSSYADPEERGERVWFFPTASGPSVEFEPGIGQRVARRAVKLEGVPAGRYRVHLAISSRPLGREEAANAPSSTATLEVLP